MKKVGWLAGCLALFGVLTACAGAGNQGNQAGQTDNVSPGTAANVESLYKSSCLACHGANLEGGAGPELNKVGARLSKEQIAAKIENGGVGMPAFKGTLANDQIAALSDWLAAKK